MPKKLINEYNNKVAERLILDGEFQSLINGLNIYSIVSDGCGGFLVGGAHKTLDHIDNNGNLKNNWTTKLLPSNSQINFILHDGDIKFWIGCNNGKIFHITYNEQ